MRTVHILTATLEIDEDVITTTYPDGAQCVFSPPRVGGIRENEIEPSFLAAAAEMGYTDPTQYAIEHEIAHHLIAAARKQPHSPIVWDAAHKVKMNLSEPARAEEEHLVNRLQRYVNTGEADPYGVLESVLAGKVQKAALGLLGMRCGDSWMIMLAHVSAPSLA